MFSIFTYMDIYIIIDKEIKYLVGKKMTSCQLEVGGSPLTLCDNIDIINDPIAWEKQ